MSDAQHPIDAWRSGLISPEVALARLLLSGLGVDELGRMLPQDSALAASFASRRAGLHAVAAMVVQARIDHAGARTPQAIAAMFDRAVVCDEAASVAAYTLGDLGLLAQGTAEIVEWLRTRGCVVPDDRVLDLGCGTGRVAAALAPLVGGVLGLDVSAGMIAAARARHGGLLGLAFEVTDGAPPDRLPAASFGLVVAVDSFPYLVQAGVADAFAAACARLLRPGGALVVLNLSYDGGDVAHARGWGRFGFRLEVCGERPFRVWDGAAFLLRRENGQGLRRWAPSKASL